MINIALGFDKKFAQHACVTIKSILYNNKNAVNFYLMIDKSVSWFYKTYLKYLIKSHGSNVCFYDMTSKFQNLFSGTWSKAMYYPISLASICPESRILFLDSDVVVNSDLTEFYNTDLTNVKCAAVQDYGMKSWIKQKHEIMLSNNSNQTMCIDEYFSKIRNWDRNDIQRYFNSGVLLLNLDEIRKDNSEVMMLDIIKKEKLACPDQDCFNICFHDSVKIMPIKYNFMVLGESIFRFLEESDRVLYEKIISENDIPVLIHYLNKPWLGNIKQIPFGTIYYKYRNMMIIKFILVKSYMKKLIRLRLSKSEIYFYLFGIKIFSKQFN